MADRTALFNGPPLTGLRNNEVRSVMLYGIPIVALVIDGYERLCLAQISNTLLKAFSYNEIHNRRVALGITCVQCTPVQLELLRRAGAMPVSSRRCGLITKREAERLCKSFLADTRPPKLPDNFAFDVMHDCAWGCRGSFVPSRYNSSRAKCIKCAYCGLFFSPNKFIFHSHRLPESKYVQPDAANFNSWRRHIKLAGTPPEEVVYAWEDVKAMFNGGSRKRVISSGGQLSKSCGGDPKRSKISASRSDSAPTGTDTPLQVKPPYFPVVPLPNKGFALQPPAFVPTAGAAFGLAAGKPLSSADIRQTFAEYMWAGKQPFPLPYGNVLWPRPGGIVPQSPVELQDTRKTTQTCTASSLPYGLADTTTIVDSGRPLSSASEGTTRSFPDHPDESPASPLRNSQQHSPNHTSAFRPVGRARTLHVEAAAADTAVDTTTTAGGRYDTLLRPDSRCCYNDDDEVDVTDVSNDGDVTSHGACSVTAADDLSGTPPALISVSELTSAVPDTSVRYSEKPCRKEEKIEAADSLGSQDDARPSESVLLDPERIASLSKDELKEVLLQEAEARRRAEREYQMIRDTFEEQVRKEIAYREEVAKQLQIVREAHDALHNFSCKMLASRHCTECGYKPSLPE